MNQQSGDADSVDEPHTDENRYIAQRREKLAQLRNQGQAFPNHFRRADFAGDLLEAYSGQSREQLEKAAIEVKLAGRMMFKRVMGKASFAQLQDMSARIQIFVQREALGEDLYDAFKHSDIGDIFGVNGELFLTKTGELT
ncbi:MAG: OB-fold nucleic acid binding domain-containing protein, partial [Gammaproteobacteria bacterium]